MSHAENETLVENHGLCVTILVKNSPEPVFWDADPRMASRNAYPRIHIPRNVTVAGSSQVWVDETG